MPERLQIALIGFMGSGKSTIGPLLADDLGFRFIDLDAALVERAGCGIPEIFARWGEEGFRKREREILAETAGRPRQILATGGGVVTDQANVALLRATGSVVWLVAAPETILARVERDGNRPLLSGDDPAAAVAALLAVRTPLYRGAADLSVDTDAREPAAIAMTIADWYRNKFRR